MRRLGVDWSAGYGIVTCSQGFVNRDGGVFMIVHTVVCPFIFISVLVMIDNF